MGFFKNMFGGEGKVLPHNWKVLDDETPLEKLDELSAEKPVIILKHSTTCGISAMAKHGLEDEWDLEEDAVHFFYLDLLRLRHISNAIASHYKVPHQSPQIIVVKKGKAVYNASHQMVQMRAIKSAI